ncbi:MAG: hypothetical protein WCT47_07265 [Betaproteobacteria bacterium]
MKNTVEAGCRYGVCMVVVQCATKPTLDYLAVWQWRVMEATQRNPNSTLLAVHPGVAGVHRDLADSGLADAKDGRDLPHAQAGVAG